MPQRIEIPRPLRHLLRTVISESMDLEQAAGLLESARNQSGITSHQLDRFLLEELRRLREGLDKAQVAQQGLKEVLDRLTQPPWHPAVYLRSVPGDNGVPTSRAMVLHGTARRVVGLADDVDPEALSQGDDVFLSPELNQIVARAPYGTYRHGEIAVFQRTTPDGRLVLRHRGDEEVVVDVGGPLQDEELLADDLVRWQRDCWMAFEKIPRAEAGKYLLESVADIGRDQVGGQDANLERLIAILTTMLVAPDVARLYGVDGRQSVLLVGRPGCGKTLMARVAASEVTRIGGRRCRFAVVKPGELEDPYVGVTQRNIRECFRSLALAAEEGPVVVFFDEIESVGRIRGNAVGHHSDRFLAALLAEIDGFADRSDIAIIAASNRKDLIDPALLERLCDVEIVVNRPNMQGAHRIFEIHLPESCRYAASEGEGVEDVRAQIIETAVSRLYSPNADNEVCVVQFRDGKTRTIRARELASGRCIAQVCRAARQAAFLRHVHGGEKGLSIADMEAALSEAMARFATTLTPQNARAYLADLPQDCDAVSVTPIDRKVAKPRQYLHVA